MTITHIQSTAQFDTLVKTKALVADFTSGFCKPCGLIGPKFEQLSKRYPNVVFVVVDGDKFRDLVFRYEITGLPTFIMFRGGRVVDVFVGLGEDELERRVTRFVGGG
ncbi:Thioredoxin [Metarhizium rileyi]|uniref:Thioredoxin n=1 Tax=Metarhizium rileyi (strain RCEF 4871) TaxID=1649241 RepID=A0A166X4Q3_METRR|nr:Thioredoxin [Metarhizium rileyi RCEF 4871]